MSKKKFIREPVPRYNGVLPFPKHEHNQDDEETDYGEVDDFGRAITEQAELDRVLFYGNGTTVGKAEGTLGTVFPSIPQARLFEQRTKEGRA